MSIAVRRWLPISALVAVFAVLATIYSVVVPLGEGPDEPGHAAYVFFLARTSQLPDQRANDVPGEGHQPPLAYLLATPAVLWLPATERVFDLPGNPQFIWNGGHQVNAAGHGSRELWPWQAQVWAWHLARLASVLCGAATVFLAFLAARALAAPVQAPLVALIAAGLVALNPQVLFTSGLVTNDMLLAAIGAGLVWLALRRTPGSLWQPAMAIGAVLGAGLLTKQSAVALAPLAVFAAAGVSNTKPHTVRARIGAVALMLATTALISGWWFARNWQLYGDPLGLAAFQAEFTTQPFDIGSLAAWRGGLLQLHASFWARFGWMNVFAPRPLIWLFGLIELLALIGLALHFWRGNWRWQTWLVLALAIAPTMAWLILFAHTAGLVAWQGRLMFPALAAMTMTMAVGLAELVRSRWWLPALGGAVLVVVALWLPWGVIQPLYPQQTLSETAALAQIETPIHARFSKSGEPGAELRGIAGATSAQSGGQLPITLIWHALGRQARDWTVFVHLVDQNGQIVAEINRKPRNGAYPTNLWTQGDWIVDPFALEVPKTLASGSYTLRIGFYDADGSLQRAGVYNEKKRLIGDYLTLGSVRIAP